MLLTRLYLRNFRVYEDELDLALPPGLVGIYGANGAGKSTLLEAITFTLWGRARTGRDEIRSSGVGGDCVTELEFEHEGHLYLVRRSLTGINATMRAEAHCDGLTMSEGATDTRRYVQSVLGMDDVAFRASVFAEQKQLAAFSSQAPAERRRLVLQLLGITPLDGARDAARRDARETEADLVKLRGMLPDVEALSTEAADAEAAAAATEATAATEVDVAAQAGRRREEALAAFERVDRVRQAHERVASEARHAAAALDREEARRREVETELAPLATASQELAGLREQQGDLSRDRAVLDTLRVLASADRHLAGIAVDVEVAAPDASARARLATEVERAASQRDAVTGLLQAAKGELTRARDATARSSSLSAEAACPLCGQALGHAFDQVRAHRAAEVEAAEVRLVELEERHARLTAEAGDATAALAAETAHLEAAAAARRAWEQQAARRADAELARSVAASAVERAGGPGPEELGDAATVVAVGTTWRARVDEGERVAASVVTLTTRLERRPVLEAERTTLIDAVRDATKVVGEQAGRLAELSYDPATLDGSRRARVDAEAVAAAARQRADAAGRDAVRARTVADAQAKRVEEATAQHAKLADLQDRSRHLSRLAVLLGEFRNTVVATVGPRLAAQAADLFAELTDREYDRLEVDPETFELQISDAGRTYGLDRFSGSEIDLANLALRVAISEHVRFQSGGSVGLLVLDEVFGPLDDERKARMLQALEQLRGRFRQVLVVTHDTAIKEQLPNAIEVLKRPGRRATARLSGD